MFRQWIWTYDLNVLRLRELWTREINQENAQAFIEFLERTYGNNSWEQNPYVRGEVDAFLVRLQGLRYDWVDEIQTSLQSSTVARWELRTDVWWRAHEWAWSETLEEGNRLFLEGSLSTIGVSVAQAESLAQQIIWNPLTAKDITDWQAWQMIDSDGVIGIQSYLEMRAWEINDWLRSWIESFESLSDRIPDIKQILEFGQKTGIHLIAMRVLLEWFKSMHSENPGFENRYQEFYDWYEEWENTYNESEQAQEDEQRLIDALWAENLPWNTPETPAQREERESIYRLIQSGRPEEAMNRVLRSGVWIASHPLVLIFVAWLFLFWKFGASSRFTNAFWKRALIVAAWVANLDSFRDMRDDAVGLYNRSILPRRNSEWARENLYRNWEQEDSEFQQLFSTRQSLEDVQEKFREDSALRFIRISDIPRYIETINSWNLSNLPEFMQNITLRWQNMTAEQLRVFLSHLHAASQWTSYTYIYQILDEPTWVIRTVREGVSGTNAEGGDIWLSSAATVGGVGLMVVWAVLWWKAIVITWGLLWAWGIISNMLWYDISVDDAYNMIVNSERWRRSMSQLEEALSAFSEWSDVRLRINEALNRQDWTTLESLRNLQASSPEYSEQIQAVILALARIEITSIKEILNISSDQWDEDTSETSIRRDISSIREMIGGLSGFRVSLSDIPWHEEVLQELNQLIIDLEGIIRQQERQDILTQPQAIQDQIRNIEAQIASHTTNLERERSRLRASIDINEQANLRWRIEDLETTIATLRGQISELESGLPETNRVRSELIASEWIIFITNLIRTLPDDIDNLDISWLESLLVNYEEPRWRIDSDIRESQYTNTETQDRLRELAITFNSSIQAIETRLNLLRETEEAARQERVRQAEEARRAQNRAALEVYEGELQEISDWLSDFDFFADDSLERLQQIFSDEAFERNTQMISDWWRIKLQDIEEMYIERIISIRDTSLESIRRLPNYTPQSARWFIDRVQKLDEIMSEMSWAWEITSHEVLQTYIRDEKSYTHIQWARQVIEAIRDTRVVQDDGTPGEYALDETVRSAITSLLRNNSTTISTLLDMLSREVFETIPEVWESKESLLELSTVPNY